MLQREENSVPFFTAIMTYFGYAVLMLYGYMRDFFGHIFLPEKYKAPVVRIGARARWRGRHMPAQRGRSPEGRAVCVCVCVGLCTAAARL